ncbi:histidine phosphatase superfamily [Rhizophagus diaphanus]|nr:histidine phosphatase superfamily [Rhizophagus diaphanus] [Rhizophagus sp. MUCL 43196]
MRPFYHILHSVFIFALLISYNPTLCKRYKYSLEELINAHLFWLEPAQTAFNLDIEPISYPDKCELKQLHLNTRHGARLPDAVDISAFDKLEKVFADVPVAKEWYKNPFRLLSNFQLVKRGELEPFFDGLQSRKRYPKFWKGVEYNPEIVKFQSSATSRAGASSMAFSEGLFNGEGPLDICKSKPVYIWSLPTEQDYILQPHLACARWNQTVFTNNKLLDEQLYSYGNKTLKPIANRLSKEYNINPPLDPHLLPFIFNYCQAYIVQFHRTDTWCSLLSPKELLLLRYYWDLRSYYILQYGNPFNERVGCGYYTQLVNGVEDYLNGKSEMIADIKNSHGFTLLILFTTLGVFKEKEPLTADLTYEQIKKVRFTEYASVPWSSTFYFEIYTCSDDHNKVLIRALLNFKPFLIPGCESEYCEWNKFKEILGDKIGCDFKKMCAFP